MLHANIADNIMYNKASLFCCIVGCVLPLQKVVLSQSPPTFSVLCCPCSHRSHNIISPAFWSSIDFVPFICHSVLLMVHLFSFIWSMCPAISISHRLRNQLCLIPKLLVPGYLKVPHRTVLVWHLSMWNKCWRFCFLFSAETVLAAYKT